MNNAPRIELESKACCGGLDRLTRDAWQERYENKNTGWDRGEASPMLKQWLDERILEPCRILVTGCGRGHEVIALAQAGFEVVAVDFADAAVESLRLALKEHRLNASVVQSDLFAFCPPQKFDAIYEQTCLCALHPTQWDTYQQLLSSWIAPGGKLYALFIQSTRGDGPPYHCAPEMMQQLFTEPFWTWVSDPEQGLRLVTHPSGMHELAAVLIRNKVGQ
jgi:methyl halide transferase